MQAPPSFWPTSLEGWLTVAGVVVVVASAVWKWLLEPLKAEDRKHRSELARLAQFEHTISGQVHMLAETLRGVEDSKDVIQRDLGKLEARVAGISDDAKREADLRNQQHVEVMRLLGDISGQLRVMHQLRREE